MTPHPTLLLHGALGAAATLQPLAHALPPGTQPHAISFNGHGQAPLRDFSIPGFAHDALQWLDDHGLPQAHLIGYSMGGYVALFLAAHHPHRVASLACINTQLDWQPTRAQHEARKLDPDFLQQRAPALVAQLQALHGPQHWQPLLARTAALLHDLGQRPPLHTLPPNAITAPMTYLWGEADRSIDPQAAATWAHRHAPQARLHALPHSGHPIESLASAPLAAALARHMQH